MTEMVTTYYAEPYFFDAYTNVLKPMVYTGANLCLRQASPSSEVRSLVYAAGRPNKANTGLYGEFQSLSI